MSRQFNHKIYNSHIEEIHSFDAFYSHVVLRNNNLVIPYINLGISLHPANPTSELMFFNFAYMVFTEVSYLDIFLERRRYKVLDRGKKMNVSYHFGGTYLDYEEAIFNDMEICSEEAYLQIVPTSQLSKEMWMPSPRPGFERNIDIEEMNSFFNVEYFPANIKELVK